MIKSMTGFGRAEAQIARFGKISVEARSINHKFLDAVIHLPEGMLSLEEKIKKELEQRIKRGRVTLVINISDGSGTAVAINKALIKDYLVSISSIKKKLALQGEVSIDTLLHLPGVLTQAQRQACVPKFYPALRRLITQALDDLIRMRQREGKATHSFLNSRAVKLKSLIKIIARRFKQASAEKLMRIESDEERAVFLKSSDITEELERLVFHISNFKNKILKSVAIGKELDFIAQEMQREANTLGAKSFDTLISAMVIQIKSQVEKIREQVQNVE